MNLMNEKNAKTYYLFHYSNIHIIAETLDSFGQVVSCANEDGQVAIGQQWLSYSQFADSVVVDPAAVAGFISGSIQLFADISAGEVRHTHTLRHTYICSTCTYIYMHIHMHICCDIVGFVSVGLC